ncbi:MAG: DUF4493 domain-containing protein [Bacteroides sp.]|nr:DUF4493 domain-containing protein [Bacteroides sp.]MBD5271368.1 DUF4493 domain-containing protein [Bacteroides sp.]
MKFKIFSLSLTLAAMAALSSCGDDWQPDGDSRFAAGTGGAYSGTIDVDVASEPTKAQGRAEADTDCSSFIVSITAKGSDEIVKFDGELCSWSYSKMPEIITLPVGNYTLHVKSHEPEAVAWSTPYFEGQTDFTVVNNKVVNIGKVHCSFRSLKIGVIFDEDFLEMMDADNSSVTISAGSAGTSAVWTPSETRCAYFYLTENNPTVVAYFSGVIDGQTYTAGKTITDAVTGDYYTFTFSLNQGNAEPPEEFGSGVIPESGISIDVDMVREEIGNQLKPGLDINGDDEKHPNAEEWPEEPVKPVDPVDPTPPSDDESGVDPQYIGINENDINDIDPEADLSEPETLTPYIVKFQTESPITGMTVQINSPFLTEEFLGEVGLSTFLNLGEPGDLAGALNGFGLCTGNDVIGKTSLDFVLTTLIPMLNAYHPKSDEHEFVVTVSTEGHPDFVKSLKFRNL